MKPAPPPDDEAERLLSLRALQVLDTPPEERFDRLARLAQSVLGAPIALISLIDERRQWIKSGRGLDGVGEIAREQSLCAYAILQDGVMEVPDLSCDERFLDHPLVGGGPRARFYAACPIHSPDGRRVGALCVADPRPRALSARERDALKDLAALAEDELAASALGRSLSLSEAFERQFRRRRRARAKRQRRGVLAGFSAAALGAPLAALAARASAAWGAAAAAAAAAGAAAAAAAALRDIESRRDAEERTDWLNARLRAILDSAKDVAIIATDLSGMITIYNAGAEKMFGYRAEEVIGRLTPAAFMGAEGVAAHARELGRRLGREVSQARVFMETARVGGEFEWVCRRKDGSRRVVGVSMAGLAYGGRLSGTLAIGRDVTEQRRAEEESARSAERLRAVFDASTASGIIVSDAEGMVRLFNAGAQRLLGYSAEEVVGRVSGAAFHDRAEIEARAAELAREFGRPPTEAEILARGVLSGGIEDREWTYVRKDGGRVPVRVVLTAIRGPGGALEGFVGVVSDMSAQRRAREEIARARDMAVEAAAAKSRFLANVSHEIRTPMNAILGLTGLLFDEERDADKRERLGLVRSAAEALLTLMNDVIDFSRAEAGELRLAEEDFDPREMIARAVDLLAPRARDKGLALSREFSADLPARLRGDPARLRQVLVNLISNAVKFTDAGFVRVVARRTGEAARPAWRIEVGDSGVGIPPQALSRLFVSFSQVDSSATRRHQGAGLGLAISRQLVERMGGRIGVDSEVGKGSVFWLELPLIEGDGATAAAAPARAESGRALRVLVVEDNDVNRRVIELTLRRLGHSVESAAGGREALEALASASFDLVLMDGQMPDMDGWEATRELRRREAAASAARTLVAALTADAMPEDRRRCFEAGMDEVLTKPVRAEELARVLDGAAAPVWDAAALARLRELAGERGLGEILARFRRDADAYARAMSDAVRVEDAAALSRAAHALKGAALSAAAARVAAACARLQESGGRAETRARLARVQAELEALRRTEPPAPV